MDSNDCIQQSHPTLALATAATAGMTEADLRSHMVHLAVANIINFTAADNPHLRCAGCRFQAHTAHCPASARVVIPCAVRHRAIMNGACPSAATITRAELSTMVRNAYDGWILTLEAEVKNQLFLSFQFGESSKIVLALS